MTISSLNTPTHVVNWCILFLPYDIETKQYAPHTIYLFKEDKPKTPKDHIKQTD
jgi:hypothetical protein